MMMFSTIVSVLPFLSMSMSLTPPAALRSLLSEPTCHTMPCIYDGLTSKIISSHPRSFNVTFLTGFGSSAVRGYSDSQIIDLSEHISQARVVGEHVEIPCIADGDTGGISITSIRRMVFEMGKSMMAGVMIEDQKSPKRCGHVDGKEIVGREEAVRRVRIACDARDEFKEMYGTDGPLILARTDARGAPGGGYEEAIERCQAFIDAGADITFLEAPESAEEMREYCRRVPGPKLANCLEGGKTPILSVEELEDMGYSLAAYPLTLLSATIKAVEDVLDTVGIDNKLTEEKLRSFKHVKEVVGFGEVDRLEKKYNI